MKVLLAVDGSSCSETAVRETARRPWPSGTEIKVISAIELTVSAVPETWTLPHDYFEETERVLRAQAEEVVGRAVATLESGPDKSLEITSEVIEGSPKHVILEEAERWHADLIMVGSHGRKGLERFLLGSVSQAVAAHAKCSVEIVRCAPDRTDEAG
jgi:nucleotide-binding universal stress UspA family protein